MKVSEGCGIRITGISIRYKGHVGRGVQYACVAFIEGKSDTRSATSGDMCTTHFPKRATHHRTRPHLMSELLECSSNTFDPGLGDGRLSTLLNDMDRSSGMDSVLHPRYNALH